MLSKLFLCAVLDLEWTTPKNSIPVDKENKSVSFHKTELN
jgi:hypothetical protein